MKHYICFLIFSCFLAVDATLFNGACGCAPVTLPPLCLPPPPPICFTTIQLPPIQIPTIQLPRIELPQPCCPTCACGGRKKRDASEIDEKTTAIENSACNSDELLSIMKTEMKSKKFFGNQNQFG
ncbi:unnamed protein product [Caenorhabditis angaria]|uniref:Uncharacterized protein n=1 Tax=Caenorhabditis angaria TaxID=860376 RepID=A0A9P1IJZ8_9PELO|nr:unnamed protein product [Caenorhabditis angaria]